MSFEEEFPSLKKLTDKDEMYLMGFIALGCLVIGLVLGYLLAMWGVFEIMNHIQIENMIIDLNETKMVEAGMEWMNRTGNLT
jgi:hypothetical protein